eukprot:1451576-Pleurochrysis_carterae.AAC.1
MVCGRLRRLRTGCEAGETEARSPLRLPPSRRSAQAPRHPPSPPGEEGVANGRGGSAEIRERVPHMHLGIF